MCEHHTDSKLLLAPKKFKEEAIALVLEQGYSAPQTAKILQQVVGFLNKLGLKC